MRIEPTEPEVQEKKKQVQAKNNNKSSNSFSPRPDERAEVKFL